MLGVRNLGDDPVALQRAFDGFEFWGALRLASQTVGYFANMWSLVAILWPGSEPAKP
jgi:hypothetical protein